MEPDDAFVQQVRDVLDHLYDYPYLQTHPLTEALLAADRLGPRERMRSLRALILQAIEELNPGPDVPFRSLRARVYSVLNLRYVEGFTVEGVARELAVSERQLYRDLRKAESDLAALLWVRRSAAGTSGEAATQIPRGTLVQREVERLGSEPEEVHISALLEGAQTAVARLCEQRDVELRLDAPPDPIVVETQRLLARQALVSALSHAVQDAQPGTLVALAVQPEESGVLIRIRYTRQQGSRDDVGLPAAAQQLVRSLGGSLEVQSGPANAASISIRLRGRRHITILVIDDNEGLVELLRRYLFDLDCRLLAALSGKEGLLLAESAQPEVIILDVMMPQNDGWEVLQWLQNHEQTRHIPVIVCSVLDDPQLALSLGAAGFLAKPVKRAELLAVLQECWEDTRPR